MSRRNALWLSLGVMLAVVAGFAVVGRRRRLTAAPLPAIVAPRPEPVVPATPETPLEEAETPLRTWVRVAIIAAALLAFLAVSLIATKT